MNSVEWIAENYNYYVYELSDPRTREFFFNFHPLTLVIVLAAYVYSVKSLGPRLMANRPAYDLKYVIIAYNVAQMIVCFWIFMEGGRLAWFSQYNYLCEPPDWEDTPLNRERIRAIYAFYILKIVDLLDTVFFVLRKKNNHISFLHVYHHSGMIALSWGCVRFIPSGHNTLIGFINLPVHFFMYLYYTLTILNYRNDKFKKLLTQMQMVQFCINFLHSTIILFQPNCKVPRFTTFFIAPQNLFMLFLFADFYIKSYVEKETKNKEELGKVD